MIQTERYLNLAANPHPLFLFLRSDLCTREGVNCGNKKCDMSLLSLFQDLQHMPQNRKNSV